MKSIIIEDKDLSSAISKGLMQAGNPVEFQVKIIKQEKKSFLYIFSSSQVCKIIFTYDTNFEAKNNQIVKEKTKQQFYEGCQQKTYSKNNNTFSSQKNYNNSNKNKDYYQKNNFNDNENNSNNYTKNNKNNSFVGNNEFNKNKEESLSNSSQQRTSHIKKRYEQREMTSKNEGHNQSNKSSLADALSQNDGTLKENKFINEKKNHISKEDSVMAKKNSTYNASVQEIKTIDNTNNENFDKNQTLSLWKQEHIAFIEEWVNITCKNFNLCKEKPLVTLNNNVVKISLGKTCNPGETIMDKHLSSSLVVILHEVLKSKFNINNTYNNKIIATYEN
jgi:hypothetical protein